MTETLRFLEALDAGAGGSWIGTRSGLYDLLGSELGVSVTRALNYVRVLESQRAIELTAVKLGFSFIDPGIPGAAPRFRLTILKPHAEIVYDGKFYKLQPPEAGSG